MLYENFDDNNYYTHYSAVLKRIYGEDIKEKPPLGDNPFLSTAISDAISIKLNLEKNSFYNTQTEGAVRFDYKKNSGLYVIGSGQYEFITMWSDCGAHSVHCYRDRVYRIGYSGKCNDFPSLESIPDLFDFSSRVWCIKEGEIVILENGNHHFAAIKVLSVELSNSDINNYIEFEYKIYAPDITR